MARTTTAARCATGHELASDAALEFDKKNEKISISCYHNEVPFFIVQELDALYASLYSSMIQFVLNGAIDGVSTYVAHKRWTIVAIFLFRHESRKIQVLNEVIHIDAEEIERFTTYIFSVFTSVSVISFRSIETNLRALPRPFQRFNYLEDIVLALPGTPAEYHASLGKATRTNMKQYLKRLARDFPSFRHEIRTGAETDEAQVREIIALNKARRAARNKGAGISDQETQRIVARAKACGLVGMVTIDGRICAGVITYRTGDNYFLGVLAHDPALDHYRPGILCCYLTICACIERKGQEFHFLWGHYEYKYRLGGVRRDLDNVTVYRSAPHCVLNGDLVLKNVSDGYARRILLWLQDARRQNRLVARLLINPARRLRILLRQGLPWTAGRN